MNKGGYTVPLKALPDMMPLIIQGLKDGEEVRLSYELGYVTISFHDMAVAEIKGLQKMLDDMQKIPDNPNNQ